MTTRLEILLDKIKVLETGLVEELQKQDEEFSYEIRKRRVFFEENIFIRLKEYAKQAFCSSCAITAFQPIVMDDRHSLHAAFRQASPVMRHLGKAAIASFNDG